MDGRVFALSNGERQDNHTGWVCSSKDQSDHSCSLMTFTGMGLELFDGQHCANGYFWLTCTVMAM